MSSDAKSVQPMDHHRKALQDRQPDRDEYVARIRGLRYLQPIVLSFSLAPSLLLPCVFFSFEEGISRGIGEKKRKSVDGIVLTFICDE